jgi:hypothetical protein
MEHETSQKLLAWQIALMAATGKDHLAWATSHFHTSHIGRRRRRLRTGTGTLNNGLLTTYVVVRSEECVTTRKKGGTGSGSFKIEWTTLMDSDFRTRNTPPTFGARTELGRRAKKARVINRQFLCSKGWQVKSKC